MRGLYALPPGADFAAGLVAGLRARFATRPPEALAQVTLYLNAARTLHAVRQAFDRAGPLLLPRLRLIADLGAGPLVPPLARMLDLASLIEAAARTQPQMIAGQSVPALAQSLAALMAEMQLEGVEAAALDRIDVGEHAAHWQRALAFLRIAAHAYLTPEPVDRESRQRAAAQALARDWAEGCSLPPGPVIVAGSTGSHGATRAFMQAVARLPEGAVVLPGFDFSEPPALWDRLLHDRGEEHPQARFAPLVAEFGPPRPWHGEATVTPRARLVALALRPAPVTDQWVAEGPALGELLTATEGVSLIEADQPQAEADAIALAMRAAVAEGRMVTLIAADRGLTRRVTAALDRWRLIPDDSAGRPLSLSPAGLFLRQLAALPGRALAVEGLVTLLKNQRVAMGDRGEHLRHARDLELHLRAHGPAFPDADFLARWGEKREGRGAWAAWLGAILARITPMAADRAPRPVPERLTDLTTLAEAFAAGPWGEGTALWADEAGRLCRSVLAGLARAAHADHRLAAHDFAALIGQMLDGQALRSEAAAHPLIRIRGPREARSDAVGLVILGGLNEGGWPQTPAPDPWLSRAMRLSAGLHLPERAIGLAGHDFQQGINAPQVILTRARRDAEAETVPARWLNRLLNLLGGLPEQGGAQALALMRARGGHWLALADSLARPRPAILEANPPAPRPAPIPPPGALEEISVTQVSRLIRDPYAVYAEKILRLRPLQPLRPSPDDPRLRGMLLHEVAEKVTRDLARIGPDPAALEANFRAIAAGALDQVPWPAARAFLAARLEAIAAQLAEDDASRLTRQQPVVVERGGGAPLPQSGLRLTARPDRLDRDSSGAVWIYDYKSGSLPTQKQIDAFDKQLPLTGALVLRGGFAGLGPAPLAGAAYIHLGGEGRTEARTITEDGANEAWARLDILLAQYQAGRRGFTALRAIERGASPGDYAHLARFGEWDLSDPARPRRVGG